MASAFTGVSRLSAQAAVPVIGLVVIGRNEGERLKRCLRSLIDRAQYIVYVDSGSTDDSVAFARSLGVEVVELDRGAGYSAARARNAGLARIAKNQIPFVQFVDGDCAIDESWIRIARRYLESHVDVAVVVGHLAERDPSASLWHRLCNLEWRGPLGDLTSCGGIHMARADVLTQLRGFREDMVAGEEPELCVRLRLEKWRIERVNAPMATHDAAMTRFSQWWKRAIRGGHAYAEGAALHGRGPLRHNVQQVRSTLLWGAAIPLILLGLAVASIWIPLLLIGAAAVAILITLQWIRIMRGCCRRGFAPNDARLYATFCLLAKPAGAMGIITYWYNRLRGTRSGLIEYKHAAPAETATNPA